MDMLDFLDGDKPAEPTVAAQPEAQTPTAETPPAEGPARGPDGKFLPKAGDTPPAAEAAPVVAEAPPQAPAPVPEVAQQPAEPPVDRVSQLEAQVAGLTKALTATRQQARQAVVQPPQPTLEPGDEGYEYEQQFIQQQVANEAMARFNVGLHYAAQQHGEETVNALYEWSKGRLALDPALRAEAMAQIDPAAFLLQQYKREQLFTRMGEPGVFEKFEAFLAAAAAPQPAPAAPAPAPVVAPPQQPSPPPRSIAAAPNAGAAKPGEQPVGPGVAFDNVFKD